MGMSGNGSKGPAMPVLGPKQGPPTVPVDQVYGMMRELEIAHQVMDALGAPQGTLAERMAWRARDWLRRVGESSQTRIGIEARRILAAAASGFEIEKKSASRKPLS